jgi:hypothetical protein
MSTEITPLGVVARGVAAGVVGTALMTISQELAAKLQSSGDEGRQGGQEEAPQDPWEQAFDARSGWPAHQRGRVPQGDLA